MVLAAGLRIWGLGLGLPHLEARPDETETLRLTLEAAAGRFDFDWAIYPHAYAALQWAWAEAVLALSSGLLGQAVPEMQAVWEQEPQRLYAIGRWLSAIAGTATVALLLVAVRRELGPLVALIAGLWLAVNLLHVRESHSLKPDALLGLGLAACLAAGAAMARRPGYRSAVVGGLAVGAAGAMKYNGVLGALPVAIGAWLSARESRGLRRILPPTLVVAGVCAAGAFWLFNPFLPFNETAHAIARGNIHAVFPEWVDPPEGPGWEEPIDIDGPGTPAWIARFGGLGALVYHFAFSLWYGAGAIATLAAPAAIVWGLRSRNAMVLGSSALLVLWFAVIAISPIPLSRYLTPVLPALAIVEAAGLCVLLNRLFPQRRAAATALAVVALLAQPLGSSVRFDRLAARDDTRVLAADWLRANAVGSRVAILGTRFWHYGEPLLPAGVRRVPLPAVSGVSRQAIDYLVTHDHELYWSTLPPGLEAKIALELELLADFDPRAGGSGAAVFEANDAFYIPLAGFGAVSVPGPHIRIYRVR